MKKLPSLKLTYPLKMDGWNTIRFLLVQKLVSGRVTRFGPNLETRCTFFWMLSIQDDVSPRLPLLCRKFGLVEPIYDLTPWSKSGVALEGTGGEWFWMRVAAGIYGEAVIWKISLG